jgi:hypothetical protein
MTRTLSIRLTIPLADEADGSGRHLLFSQWLPLGVANGITRLHEDLHVCIWFDLASVQWASPISEADVSRHVNLSARHICVDVATESLPDDVLDYMESRDYTRLPTPQEQPGADAYEQFGRRLLEAVEADVNSLLAFARTEKGQYWATPKHLDRDMMASESVRFGARARIGAGPWFRWQPSQTDCLTATMPSVNDPRMLRSDDWLRAQAFVQAGSRTSLPLEILASAERFAADDEARAAVMEGVCALEVALHSYARAAASSPTMPSEYSSRIEASSLLGIVEHLGLTASVSYILPLLFSPEELPASVLSNCRRAIAARQNVVHNGQRSIRPADLHDYLQALRAVSDLLLLHVSA